MLTHFPFPINCTFPDQAHRGSDHYQSPRHQNLKRLKHPSPGLHLLSNVKKCTFTCIFFISFSCQRRTNEKHTWFPARCLYSVSCVVTHIPRPSITEPPSCRESKTSIEWLLFIIVMKMRIGSRTQRCRKIVRLKKVWGLVMDNGSALIGVYSTPDTMLNQNWI